MGKSFGFDVSVETEGDKFLPRRSEEYASKEELAQCTELTTRKH
jgi:hypothetical protein